MPFVRQHEDRLLALHAQRAPGDSDGAREGLLAGNSLTGPTASQQPRFAASRLSRPRGHKKRAAAPARVAATQPKTAAAVQRSRRSSSASRASRPPEMPACQVSLACVRCRTRAVCNLPRAPHKSSAVRAHSIRFGGPPRNEGHPEVFQRFCKWVRSRAVERRPAHPAPADKQKGDKAEGEQPERAKLPRQFVTFTFLRRGPSARPLGPAKEEGRRDCAAVVESYAATCSSTLLDCRLRSNVDLCSGASATSSDPFQHMSAS